MGAFAGRSGWDIAGVYVDGRTLSVVDFVAVGVVVDVREGVAVVRAVVFVSGEEMTVVGERVVVVVVVVVEKVVDDVVEVDVARVVVEVVEVVVGVVVIVGCGSR